MAHNGSKTTQRLAGMLIRTPSSASGYKECVWQAVAYNGSKLPLEAMAGYGKRAESERLAGSAHSEEGTPDIVPENSRHSETSPATEGQPMAQEKQLVLAIPETPNHPKQAYKSNPDWRAT